MNLLQKRLYMASEANFKKYGRKMFRAGLSMGEPCPHRIRSGGCIFCLPATFTGAYQNEGLSVREQLEEVLPRLEKSCGKVGIIAYFQDETSTSLPAEKILQKIREALSHPRVEGLILSTRPDYVSREVISPIKKETPAAMLEIGVQSIHDESLSFLNRGHGFTEIKNALALCEELQIDVGVHLILGIPRETAAMVKETLLFLNNYRCLKEIKLHNLVAYEGTVLGEKVKKGECFTLTLTEYINLLCEVIPYIRKDIALSRLFTSNVRKTGIGINAFPYQKTLWFKMLGERLAELDIYQGMAL